MILTKPSFSQNFDLPLAENARSTPKPSQRTIKNNKNSAQKTLHSVLLGEGNFQALENYGNSVVDDYQQGKITGDQFITNLSLVLPMEENEQRLQEIKAWVAQMPDSYVAWYTLGRLYTQLAENSRGASSIKNTPEFRLEQMDRYSRLGYTALEKSMTLYSKPLPSYRAAIENASFIRRGKQIHPYVQVPETFKTDLDYLLESVEVDHNVTKTYDVYFLRNTPRWGGEATKSWTG